MEPQARRVLDVLDAIGPQIANLLARLTLRKDVAQDLMQELFLKLHRSEGFAKADNPQGYAYRAAVRLGLDWRRAREARPDPVVLKVDPVAKEPSVVDQVIQAEETERVLNAISRLDEPYQSACVMRWVQQMEYEAIGAQLGKTPHQVRGLCHWGLRQLREHLGAEMLRGIAMSSVTFDGWIEITCDSAVGKPLYPWAIGPIVKHMRCHIQPTRRVIVQDDLLEHPSEVTHSVRWQDNPGGVMKSYSSKTNQVVLSGLPPSGKRSWDMIEKGVATLRSAKSLTVRQLLEKVRFVPTMDGIGALVDGGWCRVSTVRQEPYDRYDLEVIRERLADPEKSPVSLTVLVDRATGLVQKWIAKTPQDTMSFSFRYNEPVLHDMTDLGVPVDAKIVDHRHVALSPEVTALLDRLDKQVETDGLFGNYVATRAGTEHEAGELGTTRDLRLYLRKGQGVFHCRWSLGAMRREPLLAKMKGWPLPEIQDVLAAAERVPGAMLYVTDGESNWVTDTSSVSKVSREELSEMWPFGFTLSGEIWPSRHAIDFVIEGPLKIQVDLLRFSERPGQLGLQVVQSGRAAFNCDFDRDETIWWLDPSRGDVPIEKVMKWYRTDGSVLHEETTRYGEFVQTPAGQWYPRSWQTVTVEDRSGPTTTTTEDVVLQVRQDVQLDDAWFTNPVPRYPGRYQQAVKPR